VQPADGKEVHDIRNGAIVPHNNVPKYFSWDGTKYIPNRNTPIVAEFVEAYLAGRSLYSIATDLNRRGIKTFRRGFEWAATSVRAILRNRVLIGEYLGNKNFLPPITTPDKFQRVQVLLAKNRDFRGKEAVFVNIFRSIAVCSQCGSVMVVSSHWRDYRRKINYETPYRYLRCSRIGMGKLCPQRKLMRLDTMEEFFFGDYLLKSPEQLIAQNDDGEVGKTKSAIATHEAKLQALDVEISRLVAIQKTLPLKEVTTRLASLDSERRELREEIDRLHLQLADLQSVPDKVDNINALLRNFSKDPDAFNDAVLRIHESLKDNNVRRHLRVLLPSIVGKIVVNGYEQSFKVLNRAGKVKTLLHDPDNLLCRRWLRQTPKSPKLICLPFPLPNRNA
jgi:hypothetical protein